MLAPYFVVQAGDFDGGGVFPRHLLDLFDDSLDRLARVCTPQRTGRRGMAAPDSVDRGITEKARCGQGWVGNTPTGNGSLARHAGGGKHIDKTAVVK